MMTTVRTFDKPQDRAAWDELVASGPGGHLLQCWAWGELKARFGWRVWRLAVARAAAQVLFRPLPGGLGTIAYVPKGPLVDLEDKPAVRALLAAIEPQARRQRAVCLKIEPDLDDDPARADSLRALGFRPSPQTIQPRRTLLVDLDADPDEVLARMKSKTRYNVRLAGRKGVTVRPGDEADLPAFYRLMAHTAERDGFGIHTRPTMKRPTASLCPAARAACCWPSTRANSWPGWWPLSLATRPCYMYGASSDEERNRMPTYLLQWEAMLWARAQGCRTYDLWGVPDADEETLEAEFTERSDGLWGVYRFKRGFGGQLVRTVGAWDLVYAPLRYRLYTRAVRWLNRGQAG